MSNELAKMQHQRDLWRAVALLGLALEGGRIQGMPEDDPFVVQCKFHSGACCLELEGVGVNVSTATHELLAELQGRRRPT